jgi:transposase-like protein
MPLDEETHVARKHFSREFKAKVALEALRGEKTTAQLSSEHGVHATQIGAWKKQALESLPDAFGRSTQRDQQAQEAHEDRLYQQIGKLQVENDWLKKKSRELGLG